ncbi:hypothetical protein [Nocardiopsis sp. NRRL B-16309]|uniref:hypothetical protein n=1 Tax=Nocardiopsis sp. NRRL B-16309 TaxID=1519494 RepID=UPI0006ADD397|nr:hypothetical protein [Nocardiopsis sp. NRRL B-16309]KOX20775.1 hypothetical protein ADL05_04745 [Nocardiopsis sp. NRRL B-16309]
MRYENPAPLPHGEVVAELERALADPSWELSAASALVGSALYDDDQEFVERCCALVADRAESGNQLLGLAGLCLGHTARRFGDLSAPSVALAESLAARAEADPSDVDGRALDGLEDIRGALGRP